MFSSTSELLESLSLVIDLLSLNLAVELVGLLKPCSRAQGDADEYAPLRSSACSEYLLSISSAALISGIVR